MKIIGMLVGLAATMEGVMIKKNTENGPCELL